MRIAEMTGLPGPIRARSDRSDRLVEADEPLAGLQRRSGAELPGAIAIPSLLELVRKARRLRIPMVRTIRLLDEGGVFAAKAKVFPDGDDIAIELSEWRSAPPLPEPPGPEDQANVIRHLSEGQAWLDGEQCLRASEMQAADLAGLHSAFAGGLGKPWTDFVSIEGGRHHQPLHWRLLDGATVTVPGSPRPWRAHLLPQPGGITPAGFELHLVPLEIEAVPQGATPRQGEGDDYGGLLGRELAPALRQPINRIIANAETIRTRLAGPLPDQYAAYAADIANAGRHLLNLVEDLADLEAVEAPGFAPAPDRIDLAEVGRQAGGILSVRARESEIALHLPAGDARVPAIGEFRRVLQVLLNLLSNALRYSPAGTEVFVECGQDQGRAWIAVRDQGPGLDPDQAVRVFAKFERLGRKNDGGSGLGLYISRRLARAMGGDLTVHSAPGEGARFVLTLPGGDSA